MKRSYSEMSSEKASRHEQKMKVMFRLILYVVNVTTDVKKP